MLNMDMALLGQIMAFTNCSEGVVVTSKHKSAERKKAYTTFLHQGEQVCAKCSASSVPLVSEHQFDLEGRKK